MGNRNFLNGTYSRIGLGLVLAAVFLLGMVGVAGAKVPPVFDPTPVVHVTYNVYNDVDSGNIGNWALDNFTQTVNVWDTAVPDVYQVNVTDSGIYCTFTGVPSPETGTPEPTNGCGIMTGGYDGNLTTSVALVNGSQTTMFSGVLNGGGVYNSGPKTITTTKPDFSGQFGWVTYFFPGAGSGPDFTFAGVNGSGWSWTYVAPNGATWTDAGTGSSGEILTSQTGSGTLPATASITQTLKTCTVSPSATGISFTGVVAGGPEVKASPSLVTVTNTGNIAGELFLSGGDWYLGAYSGATRGQINVSATQWNTSVGPYANSWFPLQKASDPQDTGSSIAPSGFANLGFQLAVPATVPTGTYGQTITLATNC